MAVSGEQYRVDWIPWATAALKTYVYVGPRAKGALHGECLALRLSLG